MTILRHRKQNSESSVDLKQQETDDFAPQDVSVSSVLMPFLKNLSATKNPTKLPYPAQFYYPASSLQHQTTLQMNHIDLLLNANKQETPLDRFLFVVRYALSTCSLTKFPYKPFIAFIGETAHNFTSHTDDATTTDRTVFIGEQLARDPPTSCFYINNPARGVTHEGYMEMEPKFKQAHVRARFLGTHKTTLTDPAGRWNEEYFIESPDLMIRLIRLHTELGGELKVSCPSTGYSCIVNFLDKPIFGGAKNQITGRIMQGASVVYYLDGAWDEIVYLSNGSAKSEFLNRHTMTKQTLLHPHFSELPSTSGDKEWSPFIDALKQRDFTTAMRIKEELGKIDHERQQKHQQMSPTGFVPQHFAKNANGEWRIKDASLHQMKLMIEPVGGVATA